MKKQDNARNDMKQTFILNLWYKDIIILLYTREVEGYKQRVITHKFRTTRDHIKQKNLCYKIKNIRCAYINTMKHILPIKNINETIFFYKKMISIKGAKGRREITSLTSVRYCANHVKQGNTSSIPKKRTIQKNRRKGPQKERGKDNVANRCSTK